MDIFHAGEDFLRLAAGILKQTVSQNGNRHSRLVASIEGILFSTIKTSFLVLFVGFMACACGYRFAGSGKLPGQTKTVFVDVLENRSAETGIENIFTADLRYEFIRNQMGANREAAEGVLSGVIKSLWVETVSRRGENTSQERRVAASLDLRLKDRKGKIIWTAENLSVSEAYTVIAADKTAGDSNKRAAIVKLSKRLAENIYYRLTDDF